MGLLLIRNHYCFPSSMQRDDNLTFWLIVTRDAIFYTYNG